MTDQDLLAAHRTTGSPEPLCELARRHLPMVRAAALRELSDPHAADDTTQAVFLVLLRRAKSLSPRTSIAGWLFQTTRFVAADIRRAQRRRARHEQEAARMSSPTEANYIPPENLTPILNDALFALSAPDRDALILRYLESRPAADVAAALHITENTARQRIARALARLRAHLARRGFLASAAALATAIEAHHTAAADSLPTAIDALLRGTAPPAHILSLSNGAANMLRTTHTLTATLGAAAIAAAAAIALAAGLHTAPPSPTPAAATAPAHGPQSSPKATIQSAYEAAISNDPDGLLACFDTLTPEQAATLKQVTAAMTAVSNLRKAAIAKFGPTGADHLPDPAGVGLSDITTAEETATGNTAAVDLHGAGPGTVSLKKSPAGWKIDPAVLDTLNRQQVAQVAAMVPMLDGLTADVTAGKYPTPDALATTIQKAMSGN